MIKKLYMDALRYMSSTSKTQIFDSGGQEMIQPTSSTAGYTIIQTEDAYVKIPRNLESIERVMGQLEVEKKILEKKPTKEKQEK